MNDTELLALMSKRQCEVMDLLVEGLLNKQMADRLGITSKCVEAHLARALSAIGARNRTHGAVLWDRTRWRLLGAELTGAPT